MVDGFVGSVLMKGEARGGTVMVGDLVPGGEGECVGRLGIG